MSRYAWQLLRNSKGFYVVNYRRVGTALVVSLLLNLIFGMAIYYVYFNLPGHDYYSTDGVTPPTRLTPLDAPNYSSVPLLASDPEKGREQEKRVMPK